MIFDSQYVLNRTFFEALAAHSISKAHARKRIMLQIDVIENECCALLPGMPLLWLFRQARRYGVFKQSKA
ncbi:hypothetical protein G7A66_09405 [Altererythrobacter sp. SALINAS58]|uniref:hypothetical protein n=1 Tax=Alteripontixanthobacter muriae TaxID=2705546 RepID=UPI001576D7F6|nr:hypothetical protein [Alteripontixanthobacter muriae]NTZ43298.1 hypothetical protein [Alteripontixanthobacter muriae]